MPVSLDFADPRRLAALDAPGRAALDSAVAAVEEDLWRLLETRDAANQRRMRENGVTIAAPGAGLLAALRGAGGAAVSAWETQAGASGQAVLARYRAG